MKQLDKHTVWLLPFPPHILPFNSFGLLKQTHGRTGNSWMCCTSHPSHPPFENCKGYTNHLSPFQHWYSKKSRSLLLFLVIIISTGGGGGGGHFIEIVSHLKLWLSFNINHKLFIFHQLNSTPIPLFLKTNVDTYANLFLTQCMFYIVYLNCKLNL